MKNNISEELHFSELELNDGSDVKDELEKVAEESDKETQKELDRRAKVADEVNKAEADDFKDDSTKDNAKGVKELKEGKLILDEAPISDAPGLAKAYKKSRYKGAPGTDLQNAHYVEMTPEEAVKKAKEEQTWGNLRILIDGKLVKIRDIGSGAGETDWHFRNQSVNDPFLDKKGKPKYDTGAMSARQILDVASKNGNKIYWTDEVSTLKDPDLLAARAQNIESPKSRLDDLQRRSVGGITFRGGNYADDLRSAERAAAHDRKEFSKYQKDFIAAKKAYDEGQISKEEYEEKINDIKDSYWYRNSLKSYYSHKDTAARARYYDVEKALQKDFNSYSELKNELSNKDYEIRRAQDNIDNIKQNGSYQTSRYKSRLAEYERDLESAMRQIAALKMKLRYADENDKEALEKATQDYNSVVDRYANAQAEFDRIMRRTPVGQATEAYQPWGDAIKTYNKITEAKLKEDFNDLVDSLYPNGLTESRLNDLLSYKSSMILEMLDLEEEHEIIS